MRPLNRCVIAAVALVLGLASLRPAAGDDRDLLKESFGEPYVFILFDTSGSMNWSTRCTLEQLAAGKCEQLCTDRDCFVPRNGDDPASKFYQAKQALYEVLPQVEGVRFGFGTYNQDKLYLRAKHWLYYAAADGVTIPGWGPFPATGDPSDPDDPPDQDVFGLLGDGFWPCDNGAGDEQIGCYPGSPADLSDPWELARVHRLPKGGIDFDEDQTFFVRDGGTTYRVRYEPQSGVLGDPTITVLVQLWECTGSSCNSGNRDFLEEVLVPFTVIGDFSSWDNGDSRTQPQVGYFDQWAASDSDARNTCGGWDPNTDAADDLRNGYSLRFPTIPHSNPDPDWDSLDQGDVLPLSWEVVNSNKILDRLAPNRVLGEAIPDFGVARYFRDTPQGSEDFLRLKNEAARPLVANGATPLGYALADFRTWWAGCEQGSCPNLTGWSDLAAVQDPDWACRKKYLLVISDGDDTCPGRDPCSFTAALFAQESVRTYVVGYGVQNTPGNRLVCMASNGGTGEPIFPQNRQELVDALTLIFGEIQEEARSFASAAVPTVQAEVEDKIYLSSFTPLNNESVWEGHLDAFKKPLEGALTDDGKPRRDLLCATDPDQSPQSSCFLWDAGAAMLVQAPDQAAVDGGDLKLGPAKDQRRVFFPRAQDLLTQAQPRQRALFRTPDHDAFDDPFSDQADESTMWQDLFDGMGIPYVVADLTVDDSPPKIEARATVEETLAIKDAIVDNPDGTTTPIEFILGDIFHSNPVVVDRPDDFRAFAGNYYNDDVTDPGGFTCPVSNPGYRCFAKKHQRRRKMLAVGANDGMLHLFDAGVFNDDQDDSQTATVEGKFTNGSGRELMAFIPRLTLPIVRDLTVGASQVFAIDGTPRVVDVFIDPIHTAGEPPAPGGRQWRTLLVAGLREGGSRDAGGKVQLGNGKPFTSGYFALDITQPDDYKTNGVPSRQDEDPDGSDSVPNCLVDTMVDCGDVPFAAELWEFTDSVDGSPAEWGIAFDEDSNGSPDLGDAWSVPIIGRIRVLDDAGALQDRFVAIFGGGFDPENRANPQRGTWLYMVDVETGKAIYKRQVAGAAASTPAAVDLNRDGYIDWVYLGTTAGFLYKVEVGAPMPLVPVQARLRDGTTREVERVTDLAWEPFRIFNASADGNRRPIFFPPTVLNVGEIGRFALAFGTGDREELWSFEGTEGRFHVIVDEDFTRAQALAGLLPKTEAAYNIIDSESATNQGTDFVLNPPNGRDRGWVLTLDPDERIVAQAFSVSGVTIFPTFQPQITFADEEGGGPDDSVVCARTGDSRVFVLFSHNGDPILPSETGGATPDTRYMTVGEALVTPPFADQSATKNPSEGTPDPDREAWKEAIKDTLSQLFPPGTRFANYTIDVSFIRSDTGLVGPIPIPIGILEKNWRQF